MYEDIEDLVAMVRREVTTLDEGGDRPARVLLRARRLYDAPPEEVWAAISRPDRISRWLGPVSGELRRGGRYLVAGGASGDIESCEPGRRLAATWENAGETGRIEVVLAASADGGTGLALQHVARASPERWRRFGPGAMGIGWDLALLGLGYHLGGAAATDFLDNPREWSFTDEGRTFVRQSASAWGEAAAADGENRLHALEAAARAAAAYAGEGSDAG